MTSRDLIVAAALAVILLVVLYVLGPVLFSLPEGPVEPLATLAWVVFGAVVTGASRIAPDGAAVGTGLLLLVVAGIGLLGFEMGGPESLTMARVSHSYFTWIAIAVLLTNGSWRYIRRMADR